MARPPNVAVAGANGRLGIFLIEALISPAHRSKFGAVIALVRDHVDQMIIKKWKKDGIDVRIYNEENMAESLKGIDSLISVYVRIILLMTFIYS
jgi:thioester reductase-like protein